MVKAATNEGQCKQDLRHGIANKLLTGKRKFDTTIEKCETVTQQQIE